LLPHLTFLYRYSPAIIAKPLFSFCYERIFQRKNQEIKLAILPVEKFVERSDNPLVLDVRTPAEYQRGHIPGAVNLPLFTNEERSVIGTLYKQQGREPAILKGLEFVGPRMRAIVESVRVLANARPIMVHCWRGGMRSNSVAWLLQTAGLQVDVLQGGYKAFRQFVLGVFEQKFPFIVLSGTTGTGKTAILEALHQAGEQVINLEGLANHKGSAFGHLGEAHQPTQQQFENNLALQLLKTQRHQLIWLEDESRYVGNCCLPEAFWKQKTTAPILLLNMPRELRVQRLIGDYAHFSIDDLREATLRLTERLGGSQTKHALNLLETNNLTAFADFLLQQYYDRLYQYGLKKRSSPQIFELPTQTIDPNENARLILKFIREKNISELVFEHLKCIID
jgi:tRNA 2-selenouridine synthase